MDVSLEYLATCSSCNNYLSVFPISLTSENDVICGRCPVVKNCLNVKIYEDIARNIKFPCRYNSDGCFMKFIPSEMGFHEERCHFRNLKCPYLDWNGPVRELRQHFELNHKDFINNGQFQIKCDNSFNNFFLIVYNEDLILVNTSFNSNLNTFAYLCKYFSLNDTKYKFELDLTNNNFLPIISDGSIVINNFVKRTSQKPVTVKVNLLNEISRREVYCSFIPILRFCIVCCNSLNVKFPFYMRVCYNYSCQDFKRKKYFCLVCFKKMQIHCRFCNQKIAAQSFTNMLLNKESYFSCINKRNGCNYFITDYTILEHENVCLYRLYECDFCDKRIIYQQYFYHLEQSHPNYITGMLRVTEETFHFSPYIYILKFWGHLFRFNLFFYKLHNLFCFYANNLESCEDYQFEVVFFDYFTKQKLLIVKEPSKNICLDDLSNEVFLKINLVK